jgi:hypothetical protein
MWIRICRYGIILSAIYLTFLSCATQARDRLSCENFVDDLMHSPCLISTFNDTKCAEILGTINEVGPHAVVRDRESKCGKVDNLSDRKFRCYKFSITSACGCREWVFRGRVYYNDNNDVYTSEHVTNLRSSRYIDELEDISSPKCVKRE